MMHPRTVLHPRHIVYTSLNSVCIFDFLKRIALRLKAVCDTPLRMVELSKHSHLSVMGGL